MLLSFPYLYVLLQGCPCRQLLVELPTLVQALQIHSQGHPIDREGEPQVQGFQKWSIRTS